MSAHDPNGLETVTRVAEVAGETPLGGLGISSGYGVCVTRCNIQFFKLEIKSDPYGMPGLSFKDSVRFSTADDPAQLEDASALTLDIQGSLPAIKGPQAGFAITTAKQYTELALSQGIGVAVSPSPLNGSISTGSVTTNVIFDLKREIDYWGKNVEELLDTLRNQLMPHVDIKPGRSSVNND